jgi:capsular polysaccharide transport system permease protein
MKLVQEFYKLRLFPTSIWTAFTRVPPGELSQGPWKVEGHSPKKRKSAAFSSNLKLFFATVVLPTMIAGIYFGGLASAIYISESRFIVRSPERQNVSPLGMLFKNAGFSRSQDDSYPVQDFILSRDALKAIDNERHLKKGFSDRSIDVVSRFSGLDWDDSFENLHRYYQKMVSVQFDSASSITTLSTRAFTAEDAYVMNQRLVEMSEALVNQLNERGRQDMIGFAAREVADAETKAKAAALALTRYRNEQGVIDPEKQSVIPLQQIARLQDELFATKLQIGQLEKLAENNPQLPVLRQRARLQEQEIRTEMLRVAGARDHSLASKAGEYQRLVLEKEFADKMLASAMSTLELARSDAQRKQLYLERIVQPNKPDVPREPRRLRDVLITFVVSLIIWGILSLLLAGIREHHE